ncbi:hypothetical protein SAMN05216532_3812 [Streptomyces sp. 2231.1]|nr:hypothetical protein SAMN05216532_3812 [Streptomyces sp. 2231.1]
MRDRRPRPGARRTAVRAHRHDPGQDGLESRPLRGPRGPAAARPARLPRAHHPHGIPRHRPAELRRLRHRLPLGPARRRPDHPQTRGRGPPGDDVPPLRQPDRARHLPRVRRDPPGGRDRHPAPRRARRSPAAVLLARHGEVPAGDRRRPPLGRPRHRPARHPQRQQGARPDLRHLRGQLRRHLPRPRLLRVEPRQHPADPGRGDPLRRADPAPPQRPGHAVLGEERDLRLRRGQEHLAHRGDLRAPVPRPPDRRPRRHRTRRRRTGAALPVGTVRHRAPAHRAPAAEVPLSEIGEFVMVTGRFEAGDRREATLVMRAPYGDGGPAARLRVVLRADGLLTPDRELPEGQFQAHCLGKVTSWDPRARQIVLQYPVAVFR